VFVFFQMMLFVWMFILDLAAICRLSDEAKDLELLLLRQQLRIVERLWGSKNQSALNNP